MSKDHKLSDEEEKARLANIGVSVNDGQTRLNGLAVTRALGDRFAKEANCGMIAVSGCPL
jgi:protein phosphatase